MFYRRTRAGRQGQAEFVDAIVDRGHPAVLLQQLKPVSLKRSAAMHATRNECRMVLPQQGAPLLPAQRGAHASGQECRHVVHRPTETRALEVEGSRRAPPADVVRGEGAVEQRERRRACGGGR